ncbi:MAG: hypothetical protein K9M49_06795 [Candidatus Marinimicrobia bacterium]|nr:hypothetical protein [Candidatus Neomarinimicrobiota bacterium]MCF7850093.1 hypothetical protein [Candidatus Neomarinimicrobiota bacterium]MCF7904846.1 hypothetical protein [Candidatus Neomarinimicrobiota bacterium]
MQKILLMTILLVGSGTQSLAQPPQNMEAMRIWKMTEVLELTEDQTTQFLPALQIHERELRKMQHEMQALHETHEELLEKGELSQKDMDKVLKTFLAKQQEMQDLREDFLRSLPKYLTPAQQLKFIGFEHKFRQELRDFMKDRRNPRSGKPRNRP